MNYFPKFYNEECLYGLKARLLRDTLSNQSEHPNSYLGSIKNHITSLDLPSHIGDLQSATKHIVKWTVESIIEDRTIFPVYKPFLTEEKRGRVIESMISSRQENIQSIIGINAAQLHRSNYPKFCPICGEEDLNKYGEAYWHRIHQFPNIQVCPDHNCFLVEYIPRLQELRGFKYFLPDTDLIEKSSINFNRCKTLTEISLRLNNLLHGTETFNINDVNYLKIIINKGYFINGRLLQKDLQFHFQNFYKGVTNKYLSLRISESYNWIRNIVHHPKKVFNPYQHLLFHRFVELLDLKCFQPKKEHPFGIGPWKCFNKSSTHYLHDIITEFVIEDDHKNKRKVGIFRCQCGMVYSKYYTRNGNILKENIRIRQRGEQWKKKLHECISSHLSLSETARILGTNTSTISKLLKNRKSKSRYNINELVVLKRQEWQCALSKFDENNYCESRKKYSSLYKWLFRYDREWLMSTRPSQKSIHGSQFRLDWDEIDNKLVNEIRQVLTKLKIENPNSRISKTLIGKLVHNGKYILSTKMNKLPKSQNYLSKNIDSTMDFQIRRIESAIDIISIEGRAMTKSNVLKKARIGKHSSTVEQKINTLIELV